ncbi:HAD-IIB family hydrolase [Sellimonas intestinalis]|uniref:HAD-IIB family hydrolase n=3 Tax=Lachnospirales TaxID=3085636 RepID=A0A3E3JZC3_9FIRM|nr:HAD-IIB family hydrolase [Sellimonas intestinalis]RGD36848.1 HAD-IIB family hydrolase [Sellimonas intestinalis]RGE50032.1 HAD-IIB family hydrolase [Sellimonas intestinalis]RGE53080.1 HAD-IIB family hydrolase [Sellimonas intestinalis]RGE59341.1 HAD-IIB family hydrolase [Sellimonas intestinalis]
MKYIISGVQISNSCCHREIMQQLLLCNWKILCQIFWRKVMKNLLISDFDGTLYHNNINIYKENLLFIKRWASSPDNYFSIATGRLAREIYNICTKENILYEFIVCNEGSSIIYNKFDKNDIFTFTASSCLQIYRSLIKLVESKQLKYFLETDGEYGFIDCYNLDDKCRNIVREKKKTKYNYLTFKDKNSDIKTSIFILKILDISYVDLVKKILEKELGNICSISQAYTYMALIPKKASKVEGIAKALKDNKRKFDRILMVGDSRNDIESLRKYMGFTIKGSEAEKILPELPSVQYLNEIENYL